jgi:3-oxoadipate enol-lactonase
MSEATRAATGLTFRRTGHGPDVVLINGGMMTFGAWEPVAERLETRYRVLRFDLRGQLLSPGDPPRDLAGHVDEIVALLDELGIGSAHLVGASFGAFAAIDLAARHPGRVRSLFLITAMDRITPEFRADADRMRELLAGVLRGDDRGPFYDAMVEGVYSAGYRAREAGLLARRRAQMGDLPREWFAAVDRLLASLEGLDLTPQLPSVRCPAGVAIACEDRVMDLERSRALAEALGAEILTHGEAGHGLVIEDPAWVARRTLAFLDRLEGRKR